MGIPTECPICGRRMCDHTPEERGQTFEQMMGDAPVGKKEHFVSKSCEGEKCSFLIDTRPSPMKKCGQPAKHKVGEEILHDDPNPNRHNMTAYVCCDCYMRIMGRPCC